MYLNIALQLYIIFLIKSNFILFYFNNVLSKFKYPGNDISIHDLLSNLTSPLDIKDAIENAIAIL